MLRAVPPSSRFQRVRAFVAERLLRVPSFTYVFVATLIFVLTCARTKRISLMEPRWLVTFAVAFIPVLFIEALAPKMRRLRAPLLIPFLVLLTLSYISTVVTGRPIDYALFRDNLTEIKPGPVFHMLYACAGQDSCALIASEIVLAFVVGFWPVRTPVPARTRAWFAGGGLGLFVCAVMSSALVHVPLASLVMGMGNYHRTSARIAHARDADPRPYPLVTDFIPTAAPAGLVRNGRPNVILVMMESLNGLFFEKTAPDGKPYTPTLNQHAERALVADHFYGNSMQTCRGHFTTLCSLAPSYRGKEAYLDQLDLNCLPRILRDHGYMTMLATGANDPEFDNMSRFGEKIGFGSIAVSTPESLSAEEQAKVWGWGLQDDYFYAHAVTEMKKKRNGAPFFLALAPVSNHCPFREDPNLKPIREETTEPRSVFAGSLRASDERLTKLFELLESDPSLDNTIVIVTGDHSFPADERGNHNSQDGAFEENFRAPFILEWKGHVAPRRLSEEAYSQLDIAPTVLDLIGIRTSVAFQGQSVFAAPNKARFVPLVQPYDGQILGAVRWPYKYLERDTPPAQFIFDLAKDPGETHPLSPSDVAPAIAAGLRDDVERIHLNQALLLSNAVWPQNAKGSSRTALR